MKNLINTIEDLTVEKRTYIEENYINEKNIFIGLFNTEDEARKEAEKTGAEFNEIRIDYQNDTLGRIDTSEMSYMEKIKAGAKYSFYVCSIVKKTENNLNGLYICDDEFNGATLIKH